MLNEASAPNAIFLLLCLFLVVTGLVARPLSLGKTVKMAAAWVSIFAVVFAVFTMRSDLLTLGSRLKDELSGRTPAVAGEGGSVVLTQRDDGHFYVDAQVNGTAARFLIDSGATKTTIDRALAERAGIEADRRIDIVDTANGTVTMHKGRAARFEVGAIVRQNLPISVSDQAGLNVIGMNFLSTLRGWRVDGDRLILQP